MDDKSDKSNCATFFSNRFNLRNRSAQSHLMWGKDERRIYARDGYRSKVLSKNIVKDYILVKR